MSEPWLLDSAQVCELLGVSPRWLRYAVQGGRVPGVVKLGPRAVRFDRAALRAWVDAGCPDLRHGAATSGKAGNRDGGRRGSRKNGGGG
jgi:excisionase family DNA binding protein